MGLNDYVDANASRFIEELQDLCRQPSISAQSIGLVDTAEMVVSRLQRLGAETRLLPAGEGPPVVYGEIGQGARTLMFYDHYDVQPPDPLALWDSEPFAAEIRDGVIYARGVADNKGNLMARIQAVEAYQKAVGELPIRVQFVFEGEEEVGSVHLHEFVDANRELLQQADGCIWESGYRDISGRPTITLGLKGIMYVELRAHGAIRDMHSAYATIVPNPAWRLTWALSTLKSERDEILIDGFMDHVAQPSPEMMAALSDIPNQEAELREAWGIASFINGLSGVALQEKHVLMPTCTICGMNSGYTGEGSKTVLPNWAMAKIDFRLVPDLTPDLVVKLLRDHLDRRGFEDIEIISLGGEYPARSSIDAPVAQAAIAALQETYGLPPIIYPNMAGSGPMYVLCQGIGIPAVGGVGVGHSGSNTHAPNENIRAQDYVQGIKAVGALIKHFAA